MKIMQFKHDRILILAIAHFDLKRTNLIFILLKNIKSGYQMLFDVALKQLKKKDSSIFIIKENTYIITQCVLLYLKII